MRARLFFPVVLFLATIGFIATDLYLPSLPAIRRGLESTEGLVQLTITLYLASFSLSQIAYDSDCYLIDIGRLRDGGWWFGRCDEANGLCTIREEKRTNPAPPARGMANQVGSNLGYWARAHSSASASTPVEAPP